LRLATNLVNTITPRNINLQAAYSTVKLFTNILKIAA